MEVSEAAALQLRRCRSLQGLRAAARLAQLRRGARAAVEERRRLSAECRGRSQEAGTAAEATAELRLRARGVREETLAAEGEAAAANASCRAMALVPDEAAAALVNELAAEEQRRRLARAEDSAQEEAQAALRRRAAGLSMHLAAAQQEACRAAGSLEDAERQAVALSGELMEAQRRASALLDRVDTSAAACQLLEAELQQQRDATFAWWACADDLADGHQDISAQAARAMHASREVLAERPAFGREGCGSAWGGAPSTAPASGQAAGTDSGLFAGSGTAAGCSGSLPLPPLPPVSTFPWLQPRMPL
mmetsp:Transcript_125670/g.350047  ORF Transcript_125670/g.350047 Transcript_125670/m.350047 type:complete len:307 (+) Transcript_125670:3-923(+)